MIVDDESDILYLLKPGIEKNLGYSVCTYSEPLQALKHFNDSPDAYDLVISDVRMLEMTGFEFARHIKEIRPDVKAVLMTAFDFNQSEFGRVLPSTKIDGFVTKPATLKVMSAAIEKCLY